MKIKRLLNIVLIGLISIIILPFAVNAAEISTLNVAETSNEITVSGTTEDGILAIAVVVYSGEDLIHMETCSVNNKAYSCKLNKTFANGSYRVKVADYDGGEYITKDVTITATETDTNPKTFDKITIYVGLGLLSILSLTGTCLFAKKKIFN